MSQKSDKGGISLVFVYSKDFMERVIRNLINDPCFCQSCGLYCDSCKYNAYSFVRNVRAAIQLPDASDLPTCIDNPEEYMPKKLPKADICLASGLHKDLLLELPQHIKKAGINKPGAVHILPHTAGTELLASSKDIRIMQEFLGHKNITTTEIYTHVIQEDMDKAVKKAFS